MKMTKLLMVLALLAFVVLLCTAVVYAEDNIGMDAFKQVGSYVVYGAYEQDGDESNGKEPIEWLVLDYDESTNRALLISRYALDCKKYNEEGVDITWEKCTLRTWLNGEFLNTAFSTEEQRAIPIVTVDNSESQCYSDYSTKGGNDTQDRIFLLSYAEVNKYFGVEERENNTKSRVEPTAYALMRGAYQSTSHKTEDGGHSGWWWLRSPGYFQFYAARVITGGSLGHIIVNYDDVVVRPALWINLNPLSYNEETTAVSFMRVKVNNGSNVRSGPSSDYDKIAYADAGEIYDCLGEENGWYKIKLKDGNFGYIATSRCSVVD